MEFGDVSRRAVVASLGAAVVSGLAGCGTSPSSSGTQAQNLSIEAPEASRRDERISIRVTGASPGSEVTLNTRTEDSDGTEWTSRNVYEADDDGVVDLSEGPPVDGSYERTDAMGWLWSMTPESDDSYFGVSRDTYDVILEATAGDATTQTTVTRQEIPPGISTEKIDTGDLVGVYCRPSGEESHTPVLVLHGSGGTPPVRRAQLLAAEGYAAFAPQYFGDHDAIQDSLLRVPLEYFKRAADWLRERDAVADGQVGVHGISRGGELALLLGATYDWVSAVVSYVGSGVVFGGSYGVESAWEYDGDRVPFLEWENSDYELTDGGYHRGRPAFESAYNDASADRLTEATIPVETIDAPVLLVSGKDDQVWPSTLLSNHAAKRLDASNSEDVEHAAYANAGHAIQPPFKPTHGLRYAGERYLYGGRPVGYARANADAWEKTLAYLDAGL